jgi:hypothetical protein
MLKTDKTQAEFALLAAKDISAIEHARIQLKTLADLYERSQILMTNRRGAEDLFTSFLTKAGFDVDKFEKIREQNQTELNRILEEMEADDVKESSVVKDALLYEVDRLRKSIEHLENDIPHFPKPIVLDSPFVIRKQWGSEVILKDQHIEPRNSWAKVKLDSETTGGHVEDLRFSFSWENRIGRWDVVNVNTNLMVNGKAYTWLGGGIAPYPRSAELGIDAAIYLWEWWNQPPTVREGEYQDVLSPQLRAHTGLIDFNGDLQMKNVFGDYSCSYDGFQVPPNGAVTIEVVVRFRYANYWGPWSEVYADFSRGERLIMCPAVVIERMPTG